MGTIGNPIEAPSKCRADRNIFKLGYEMPVKLSGRFVSFQHGPEKPAPALIADMAGHTGHQRCAYALPPACLIDIQIGKINAASGAIGIVAPIINRIAHWMAVVFCDQRVKRGRVAS